MTAFPVPDASNRGCPSSLAGTTLQQLAARIPPCALRSTIRCRTDGSWSHRRHVACPCPPHVSATVPNVGSLTRSTRTQQPVAAETCSNSPRKPFPALPIGDKRASPSLTVSAPNSSQKYNSLQNRRDHRAGWRPRRPPPFRPVRRSRRADASPFSEITTLPPQPSGEATTSA